MEDRGRSADFDRPVIEPRDGASYVNPIRPFTDLSILEVLPRGRYSARDDVHTRRGDTFAGESRDLRLRSACTLSQFRAY